MSDLDLDGRLDAAARTARRAGALALDFFNRRGALVVEHKGMQDLVSIADRSVEDLIRDELGSASPPTPSSARRAAVRTHPGSG